MTDVSGDLDDARFRITPSQQMVAACTGALVTSLMVTPLDVVKIRLQMQNTSSKCFLYCNGLMDHICSCGPDTHLTSNPSSPKWYHRPSHFTGTLDAFSKITRSEGVLSLWSGLGPTLVLAIPSTVVYFVTYEQLRVALNDSLARRTQVASSQPYWVPLVAGGTARVWAVTIFSPLELVRTKMQSKKLSYLEIGQALRSLLHYHGLLGLWRGLGATLFRDVPFSALYWLHYEWFKKTFSRDTKDPGFMTSFLGGAFAGSVAACITTPFDVAKTHKQIELGETEIYKGTKQSNAWDRPSTRKSIFGLEIMMPNSEPPVRSKTTTLSVLLRVYRQNGLSGIFAGLAPRVIKVAPACAIMVSSFEHGKAFFQARNKKLYEATRLTTS